MKDKLRIIDGKQLEAYKRKKHPFHSIPSLEEWMLYWLEEIIKKNCKPTTYTNFRSYIYSHILPMLADYPLNEITLTELQFYVDYKLTNGRLDQTGGLSMKTVKEHKNVIQMALKKAVEYDVIQVNPAQYVVFEKENQREVEVLEVEEQKLISNHMECIWQPNSKLSIYLGEYAGLRIGEIAALRIDDIDLKNRMIRIDESLNRCIQINDDGSTNYPLLYTTPKSDKERFVPMNEDLYHAFHIYLTTMPKQYKTKPKSPLFVNNRNNVMEPRAIRYHFKQFMHALGLKKYHFHSLRHTFATRSLEVGMDVKSCSVILGHANTKITQDRYTHVSDYQKRKEIMKLNLTSIINMQV